MKILIIEDETVLAATIAEYLSAQKYDCEQAASFKDAMDKISQYEYDCILLDLMLPGGDGMDILKELKSRNRQDGVIIISAKNSLESKIEGLQIGADDYLAKPFHLPELGARIFSVVRRRQSSNANRISFNELAIDMAAKTILIHDAEVSFTKMEFDLILYFLANKNRVISKSALAEHLTGDMAEMLDNHDFVYAHIKNLKKKLTEGGADNYIKTIYGRGYKWEA